MSKIVRTKTKATGGITADEKIRLDAHAQQWIKRIMRTEPADRDKLTAAIEGLYTSAGLKKPRVIIVPSPVVMAVAGGIAAAIWHTRGRSATDDATRSATDAATRSATRSATDDATRSATSAATIAATRSATIAATDAATRSATDAATRSATDAATRSATYAATTAPAGWAIPLISEFCASEKISFEFSIECIKSWSRPYQGGAYWGWWECYLSAFRDVFGLELPIYSKYKYWEQSATEGCFRWMHPEFCMVSDFPEVLTVDDRNRPHGESGPSHRWRDGWSLWYWHGVKVTQQIIEAPETLTISQIEGEENAEVRRVMMEKYGWAKFLKDSGAQIVNEDDYGTLYRKEIADDEPLVMVEVINSTIEGLYHEIEGKRVFVPDLKDGKPYRKHYTLRVPPEITTAREAIAWTFGIEAGNYSPVAQS